MQAALVHAQLSLADGSLFSINRLKAYVTISQDCKSNLLELQDLIDYYSRPGLTNIRHDGVQLTLGVIRKRLQACIDDLRTMDDVEIIEKRSFDDDKTTAIMVPTIQISSPPSPAQSQPAETIQLEIETDKPSPARSALEPLQSTPLEEITNSEWDASQATDVQRWSQASFFQISLETVLEEFDDTRSESDSSVYSKSSASSRSSCSERTVTPPPMHSLEACTGEHRASVEIVSDMTDSYAQHALYEEAEFGSAAFHATYPVLKLSPSHEGIQPQFDQYSPSFQLKKRNNEPRPQLLASPDTQSSLCNQASVGAEISSSLFLKRRSKWDAQQNKKQVNTLLDTNDQAVQKTQKQEQTSIDMLTDFDWLEEELTLAENSPKVHPASANPVERQSTPFAHLNTRHRHRSIAYCNSQVRSKNSIIPPPPPPPPAPSQRPNSRPSVIPNTSSCVADESNPMFLNSKSPNSRTSRATFRQTTTSAQLAQHERAFFSQSTPNLHCSIPVFNTMVSPGSPPRRPPPPPPAPLRASCAPLRASSAPLENNSQKVHVSNSKPVFMESFRSLRSSLQPPAPTIKSRRSFQRLSSIFQRPKQVDSFFNHAD
jgi:hypothetical protein